MNKKGILVTIPLILLSIIIFSALIFKQIRWFLLGGAILVGMGYLLIKIENNKFRTVILILGLVSGVGFIIYSDTLQSIGQEVWIPEYGSLKCDLARSDILLDSKYNIPDSSTTNFVCGVNSNGYTDGCDFNMKITTSPICTYKAYKCNSAGCVQVYTGITTTNNFQTMFKTDLDSNRDGYIDSNDGDTYNTLKLTLGSFCGDSTSIEVRGNAYFLEDNLPNGYGTTYEQGCDLRLIDGQAHIYDKDFVKFNYQAKYQVPFGKRIFYVTGLRPTITSNVITHNGQLVYIEEPGYYTPVSTADDGFQYVDYRDKTADSSIKCVPANIYVCNADATLRPDPSQDVEGMPCSLLSGVPSTQRLIDDSGKVCLAQCTNNVIDFYDCQTRVVCGQGYIYDGEHNTCKKVGDTSNDNNEFICQNWYEEEGIQTKYGLDLGLFGHYFPSEKPVCKTASWLIYSIIGLVTVILGTILILVLNPVRKTPRPQIPMRGRR